MFKDKLFKFLFPDKANEIEFLEDSINELIGQDQGQFAFQFDFTGVDDYGKPPHYLDGLTDVARKNYIAELENIYDNKRFMEVMNYCINMIGNKTVQVIAEDEMFKGRFMILGLKALLDEYQKAHDEFSNSKKSEERFDEMEILPE